MMPTKLPPGSFRLLPDGAPLRRFGVPPGGPFDRESFARAQVLGCEIDTFEIGYFGAELEAAQSGCIAMAGARRPAQLGDKSISANGIYPVHPGLTLRLGFPEVGVRSYVAFYPGRVLKAEQVFEQPESIAAAPLRVIAGPHAEHLDFPAFLRLRYHASTHLDRVGLKLATCPSLRASKEFPSEPQCVGAIQVTPEGIPIIIGPDGPTLGGYPKVAVVATVDHNRLAQIRPGQEITFEEVSIDAARGLLETQKVKDAKALAQLRALLSLLAF
ncbi:MAG: hypothetical protein ABL949_03540 [Fimbriimonadaceae bacterium]